MNITMQLHSDVKNRRSYLTMIFASGELRRLHKIILSFL